MLRPIIVTLASIFLYFNLQAESPFFEDVGTLTSLESEPSGIIDGHVNIMTGDFIDYEVDMVIPGPTPIIVDRTLLHNNYKSTKWYTREKYKCLTEWRDQRHERIVVYNHSWKRGDYQGQMGESVIFKWTKEHNPLVSINLKMLQRGVTNNAQNVIGAVTNVRHYQLELKKDAKPRGLLKSDGTKVVFGESEKITGEEDFYLCKVEKEFRPDNLRFENEYLSAKSFKRTLKNVYGKPLASFEICNKDDIIACDGRRCHRQYTKIHGAGQGVTCLASVDKPNAPKVYYDYWEGVSIRLPDEYGERNKQGEPIIFQSYLCDAPKIRRKYYDNHRFLEVHYYREEYVLIHDQLRHSHRGAETYNRVSKLLAPLGTDATPIPKYEFDYYLPRGAGKGGTVGVYDANHNLTNYVISSRQRIKEIQKYTKDKKCYTVENLYFGPRDTQHEIELNSRTFGLANTSNKTFCRVFRYDMQGNIIEDLLFGNLTGRSDTHLEVNENGYPITACECLSKKHSYSQDRFHLLLETSDGKVTESYIYVPETNIPLAKFCKNEKGIFLRHFYDYDENSLVIHHITDDGTTTDRNNLTGVTVRKIEETLRSSSYPVGLPLVVTQCYLDNGEKKLLTCEKNTYDALGQLINKKTYDANNELQFEEDWAYNAHGKVTHYVNSLNQRIYSYYDVNDNKIAEHGPNLGYVKRFEYDYMNRLIAETEEHPDGQIRKTYSYDRMGNRIQSSDAFGNITSVEFDEFQRPIRKFGAPIPNAQGILERPVTQFTYNEMSHPTSITDPEGHVTLFKYTLYGKPYHIRYPDGSEEHFEYDIYGRLVKEIAKNGSITLYTLDAQDRITHKQVYDSTGELLYETQAGFNTFNLLWEMDPAGVMTSYTYDGAGRKISETKAGTTTHYEYDSMGNIHRVSLDDLVKVYKYDPLKRIIEESQESNGKTLDSSHYIYDVVGRKIRTEKQTDAGLSIVEIEYDTHDIPKVAKDPNGNETCTRMVPNYFNPYGQRVLCLEVTDPMGQVTLTIHNAQGQIVQVEKKSPFGQIIQKTEIKRDFNHLAVETVHTVFLPDESTKTIINAVSYDMMQRPLSLIEAKGTTEERITHSSYNLSGQKEKQTKVDGSSLFYTYDGLGRLVQIKSSENTIHYKYHYDTKSRPILIENLIQNNKTERFYDESDHLIKEILANGLTLRREYDTAGRLTRLILPDNTAVKYNYQGTQYTSIERLNKAGNVLYQHTYTQYDPADRLIEASTIYDLDKIHYEYNKKGELLSQKSVTFEESLNYDSVGNLMAREFKDFEGLHKENFAYDALYQLNNESGEFSHTYTNDSLYNRCSKDGKTYTHNALNQLLNDEENSYQYDLSGNLTSIQGNNPANMTYDALDRITSLTIEGESYQFTYDENNRCLTQKYQDALDAILYLDQNDIGTLDKSGRLKHFRMLGLGRGAETGASVAIEIQGEVYAPFHDHHGNIIALKDKAGNLKEAYRYSAFGEEKILSPTGLTLITTKIDNPWRFSSKRTLHRLVFFGRRVYNPATGSWLTPDPIGYEAGPNLYAYLNHNPLTHHDLYGLVDQEQSLWDRTREFVRDTLSTISNGLSYIAEKTRDVIHYTGVICEEAFRNFVYVPIIRDFGLNLGICLASANQKNLNLDIQNVQSCLYTCECDDQNYPDDPLIRIININGILTKFLAAHENAKHAADVLERKVDFFHISNQGFFGNILNVQLNKMGINTIEVDLLVAAIRYSIEKIGGVDSKGYVGLLGFSQGGQVLYNALLKLTPKERSRLLVCTISSAKIIPKDIGTSYVKNYISYNEFVTPLTNPFSYTHALLSDQDHIEFIKPVEPYPLDHRFKSKTNQQALESFSRLIKNIARAE